MFSAEESKELKSIRYVPGNSGKAPQLIGGFKPQNRLSPTPEPEFWEFLSRRVKHSQHCKEFQSLLCAPLKGRLKF